MLSTHKDIGLFGIAEVVDGDKATCTIYVHPRDRKAFFDINKSDDDLRHLYHDIHEFPHAETYFSPPLMNDHWQAVSTSLLLDTQKCII